MVMYLLRPAFAWTLKGLLYTCRFFWVSPYCAIQCTPEEPHETGSERREKPGSHERNSAVQKRLSKAEREIQALKAQIATERSSWERKFVELQKKQQDLRNQLISETLARTGILLGSFEEESEGENGDPFDQNDHNSSSSVRHTSRYRGSEMMSSRGDTSRSSLSGSPISLSSACGSRSTFAMSAATSVGSWRSSPGPHRVFVPHSPLDLQPGHRVRVLLTSGRVRTGTIRYLGHLQGEQDFHLGVELESPEHGQQDGTHRGQCYFECKPGRGAFVPFNKLLMTWE